MAKHRTFTADLSSSLEARGGAHLDYLVLVASAVAIVFGCSSLFGRAFLTSATCAAARIGVLDRGAHARACGLPEGKLDGAASAPVPGKSIVQARGLRCDSLHCEPKDEEEGGCFAAGTPVATPHGNVAIETLEAGDEVLAADTHASDRPVGSHRIVTKIVHEGREVLDLTLANDKGPEHLRVTPEHPFLELTRPDGVGWSAAGALTVGALVATRSGAARVVDVRPSSERVTVYNFEVEDVHTYLVGALGAVVHNDYEAEEEETRLVLGLPAHTSKHVLNADGIVIRIAKGEIAGDKPLPLPLPRRNDAPDAPRLLQLHAGTIAAHKALVEARKTNNAYVYARLYREAVAEYLANVDASRDPMREAKRALGPMSVAAELRRMDAELKTLPADTTYARSLAWDRRMLAAKYPLLPQGEASKIALRVLSGNSSEAKNMVLEAITNGTLVPPYPEVFVPPTQFNQRPVFPPAEAYDAARVGGELRQAYALHALRYDSPAMKKKALELVHSQSPFNANQIFEVYGSKLQYELRRALKEGSDSPLKEAAELLRVKELAKDPKWGSKTDLHLLELKLARAWKKPEAAAKLAEFHRETLEEVRSGGGYGKQLAYLRSEAFLLQLELQTPEQAKASVEAEIGKIAAVDPKEAKQALDELVGRQAMRDFHRMSEAEQVAAIAKALDFRIDELTKAETGVKDVAGAAKVPADVLKRLAAYIKARDLLAPNRAADLAKAGEQIAEESAAQGKLTPEQKSRFSRFIKALEGDGARVSTLATTASFIALYDDLRTGDVWKNGETQVNGLASMLKAVGSIDSYAKFGSWLLLSRKFDNADWAKASRFGKTLRVVKFAGPVGDFLVAFMDGRSAYFNFEKGYVREGLADVGAAASSTAVAIGGIMTASGFGGPLGPYIMLGGTIGYFAFKGIKWLVSTPDEEKQIREAEVWKGDAVGAYPPQRQLAARLSVLDVKHSLEQHSDLKKAFGDDYLAAGYHWVTYGLHEGRQSSPNFSVSAYLARYPDLQKAYGANNYEAALQHWLTHGKQEGRNAKP